MSGPALNWCGTFHAFKCNHIFIPFFFLFPLLWGDIAICHNKCALIIDHKIKAGAIENPKAGKQPEERLM